MWNHQKNKLEGYDGQMISISSGNSVLSYGDVLDLWVEDEIFRGYYLDILAQTPYLAFRWETPPVTVQTLGQAFEFVVLNSPFLSRRADRLPFAKLFKTMQPGEVGEFSNLGGDAMMVVPGPVDNSSEYSHLGSFQKSAPISQLHAFWQCVGSVSRRRMRSRPLWLSTAGGGVSWLHLRLDDRPKYYHYALYRDAAR